MNDRRFSDTEIAVLKTIIQDFIAIDKLYKEEAKEWRKTTNNRLEKLEIWTQSVDGPWKAVIFILSAMTLGAITHFSSHLFRLAKRLIDG